MATRANVLIFDENGICKKQYYVHWDGYPSSLGCRLIDIVNKAYSIRLHDKSLACPEHSFSKRVIQVCNRNIRDDIDGFLEDEDIDCLHGDIEYLYFIKFNKEPGYFGTTYCSVCVIPMPLSERDSDVQKTIQSTPTAGLSVDKLFMFCKEMATFEEV